MQNATLKDCCVVDADGLYKIFVTVQTEQGADGEPKETVLGYKLAEGERLLDALPPGIKMHAGSPGFVKPRRDEDAAAGGAGSVRGPPRRLGAGWRAVECGIPATPGLACPWGAGEG